MYLHLGQYTVVRTKDIVGIFDIENSSVSRYTRNYLSQAQKNGWVINVSEEIPKSFVVCLDPSTGKPQVYISQISSVTCANAPGLWMGFPISPRQNGDRCVQTDLNHIENKNWQ